jgi:hypothetical protein
MNVVVTKLGGDPWTHSPIARGAAVKAEAATLDADYVVAPEDLRSFAEEVDASFDAIVGGYYKLRATIDEGLPTWQGPEKKATVTAVNQAVDSIVGSPGSETGVRGIGSSLSTRLRKQASVMEA